MYFYNLFALLKIKLFFTTLKKIAINNIFNNFMILESVKYAVN